MTMTRISVLAGAATALALTALSAPALAQTELLIWHMEQPPHRVERIQSLLDAFNAANPDITVRQEPQNWGEIYAKAPAAVAAGNAPDLLFAIPDFTPLLKQLGAVQPVDAIVAMLDEAHGFYPAALEPYAYDGHVWAVPLYNMAVSLWYHRPMLEAAGIAPPTTWEALRAAAEALTGDGVYGIGLPANKHLYTDQTTYALMVNNGASALYDADGSIRFDTPETQGALAFYDELAAFSPPDIASWTWGEAEACFASRACAMILQFTVITTFETQTDGTPDQLGVAAIPAAEGVADPGTIAYANGVMLLTDDPAKHDAAAEFLSFLMAPENYGRFLNMEPGLFLPVTETGAAAESFWSDPVAVAYRSQIETMLENSRSGRLFGFTDGNIFPSIAAISAQNLISQATQRVVLGDEDPADAAAEVQEMMEDAIE